VIFFADFIEVIGSNVNKQFKSQNFESFIHLQISIQFVIVVLLKQFGKFLKIFYLPFL